MNINEEEKNNYCLIVAFLSLLTPLILFFSRALDDNRLTSWQWTFEHVNIVWFFFMLASGVLAAFILSRFDLKRLGPLFLFALAFGAASLFWGQPEVIIDASRYFTQAKLLSTYGVGYFFSEWGKEIFIWTDLPLIPFLYGLLFKLFGESREVIQVFTTTLFSASCLLVFCLGKLLRDEETGFLAALLFLGIPYLYTQTPLMLVDVPTMFFFLLATYLFCRALRYGGVIIICGAAVAIFFAFFAKYSIWVFFSGLVALQASHMVSSPRITIRRGLAVAFGALLLISVFFYLKQDIFVEQIRFLFVYQKPGLDRWGEGYISTFFFQIHPFVTAGLLYGVFAAIKNRNYRFLGLVFFVLIIFVLELKRIRYTLPLFPVIALLGANGIREFTDPRVRRFCVLCVVSASLIIACQAYTPYLKTMSAINIKEAGIFLNSLDIDEVEVVPLFHESGIVNLETAIPLLDYFTDKKISYRRDKKIELEPEKYFTSPLRFTWEYDVPDMYRTASLNTRRKAVAVIAGLPNQPLPPAAEKALSLFSEKRTFDKTSGVFRHQTLVTIFF